MRAYEVNFDGLVGPTHNYAGLSFGNIASQSNLNATSNPKEAAKQGLRKMKALADQGFKQAVLPPIQRPDLEFLRQIGFTGTDAKVLANAARQAPQMLAAAYSASSMWTANAATVSPSSDTADGRVHFTAANLNAKVHRSVEHPGTSRILAAIFDDPEHFSHHPALPSVSQFGDEGAANHTRFCADYGAPGVELFVYGKIALDDSIPAPRKFPARQTREASEAIARLHGLDESKLVFAQQRPETIDAGVFHNDVIAVGNRDVLFYHEQAFVESERVLAELNAKLEGARLNAVMVPEHLVSLDAAVRSYLFNSQLLSRSDGGMTLIVPGECREQPSVSAYLDQLTSLDNPIDRVEVFDLKQSMKNGGGPACLRLRVVLNEAELAAAKSTVMMNDTLFTRLNKWVDRHYRDRLSQEDLADEQLLQESLTALDELTQILQLDSVYPFQR